MNLLSHRLSGASLLIGALTVPAHPYNLDELISEDGTGHDRATHHVSGGSEDPLFSAFFICICYHAATRTGQITPICPHFKSILVCGFLWG
jgi:hypothetical protein